MSDALPEQPILAIDWGERRIGLAERPGGLQTIVPLPAVEANLSGAFLHAIRNVIADRGIKLVVIGLPLHDNPESARKVKRFARKLREGISGVRWKFADETLTSAAAAESRREARPRRSDPIEHSAAAALILEAFLAQTAGKMTG